MTVKKRPVSPRQKMINLMYIVLLAMLALNVSNEVLKGFDIVGDSLNRTTANAAKENEAIYKNFAQQLAANAGDGACERADGTGIVQRPDDIGCTSTGSQPHQGEALV